MIKVPYLQVSLRLDMSTTNIHQVPPHEFALMTELPDRRVRLIKVMPKVTRKLDPAAEYDRLLRRYGYDKETKRPWVEVVFGRLTEGRLEQTMKTGAKHYLSKKKKKAKKVDLTPAQKAARTRAINKANKLAEEQHAQDPVSATG